METTYLVNDANAVQDAVFVTNTRHCEQHQVFPRFVEDASSVRVCSEADYSQGQERNQKTRQCTPHVRFQAPSRPVDPTALQLKFFERLYGLLARRAHQLNPRIPRKLNSMLEQIGRTRPTAQQRGRTLKKANSLTRDSRTDLVTAPGSLRWILGRATP
jgi:hypothetical protein